jgi:adenylate cyclase
MNFPCLGSKTGAAGAAARNLFTSDTMNDPWQLRVYESRRLVCSVDLTGPVELGRQSNAEEQLYGCTRGSERSRVVIATKDEKFLSRQHVLIEPLDGDRFRITNLSDRQSLPIPDGRTLNPKASCSVPSDTLLTIGSKAVRLQGMNNQGSLIQGLAEVTALPGHGSHAAMSFSGPPLASMVGGETKGLLRWLQSILDVFQVDASSSDFFVQAARALVDMVNLDSGRVLLLQQDEWRTQTLQTASGVVAQLHWQPSRNLLERVLKEKRTFWESPNPVTSTAASLVEIDAVVVAPVLDRGGAVIGALYGDRRQKNALGSPGSITEVEAMLVELLARGVAGGLARLEQEQAALAARVQFEQFFTPELARHLARQPDLLKGRDAEVSLLFCDVRGFSRISERLGPARTVEWLGEVMGALSDCVRAHAGVLVDYIGDELIAMWGAPEEQADHARLACRAGLDMLAQLPQLNERWQATLEEPMDLGIGINTGIARVGNTGSHHKFKYGPLGHAVNLASRVQGVTKYLKCRLLITGATQAQLDAGFATRRLCQVQVVNIAEPVTLHELAPAGQADWAEAQRVYEQALVEFEAKHFATAARALGNWRVQHPGDEPALLLLYRAVRCMVEGPTPDHPVWVLPGK